LLQFRRPAVAFLAAFTVIAAAACGGSSATPTVGPASAGASAVGSDPNTILNSAISSGASVTSFHIKIELNGTISAAALAAAGGGGSPLGAITSDLKLDGTTVEGDVDVANSAAHLAANVPALPALGNVPITADLIVKDQVLYYQASLTGPMYTKMDLSSLSAMASSLPVAVPTAMASSSGGLSGELSSLQQQLKDAGVTATLVGVDQIGGKDANHITFTLPLAMINSEIAAASPSPMVQIDSASIDVWIYTDNSQIAKFEVKGASSTVGNLDLVITVTNYNVPVTINAPAASDVQGS
jgi:hypothetical protein